MTVAAGAAIAPGGIGALGVLNIGGAVTLSGNSTLDIDLSGGSADALNISGVLSVNGAANLVFTPLGPLSLGSSYTVATFSTSGGVARPTSTSAACPLILPCRSVPAISCSFPTVW